MSWIKTIPFDQAAGKLKKLYERIAGPDNNIDNVLKIHSLRPHTLEGHMSLYKNVLHHASNSLPKWYLETLGVYVSYLNQCDYCIQHHFAGLKRLLNNDKRANEFMDALQSDTLASHLKDKGFKGIMYARKLTRNAHNISEADLDSLKTAGFDDGEILEINQVVSYFNYVNRTVLGLGVKLDGDILGLSPNDNSDTDNWQHT